MKNNKLLAEIIRYALGTLEIFLLIKILQYVGLDDIKTHFYISSGFIIGIIAIIYETAYQEEEEKNERSKKHGK